MSRIGPLLVPHSWIGGKSFRLAFGLTSTPMYKWLRFSRKTLLYALQHHPNARVVLPNGFDVSNYSAAIANKYPVLRQYRVWGAADGLKILR